MSDLVNKPSENNNKKKPDWLTALESQSWQAELIASGLAIFGSLSLGPYIDFFSDFILTLFPDSILVKLKYAMMYVYMAHTILVISFVGHLILRIVWAGFLGLSSVYPEGINTEKESIYTKGFLNKLKKEFPDISSYSIKLDNSCSVIFSLLCSIIIFLLSITLWICLYAIFYSILNSLFTPLTIKYILISIGSILFIFLVIISVLTTGPKKHSAFAERYSYNLNRIFSKLMIFIAYKPLFYMIWTVRTNINTKQFILGMFLIILPTTFIATIKSGDRIDLFSSISYHKLNSQISDANNNNYIDELSDMRILRPTIQSREINSNYLKLFIPEMRRDKKYKDLICGEYIANDKENKDSKKVFNNECLNKYYQISIDNLDYSNINFQPTTHSHKNEEGHLIYLSLDSIKSGQHVLKMITGYKNEANENSIRLIPFYKN